MSNLFTKFNGLVRNFICLLHVPLANSCDYQMWRRPQGLSRPGSIFLDPPGQAKPTHTVYRK
jgi:hypothetical protein